MFGKFEDTALAVVTGLIGLATVAVIVSKNAQTPSVLAAGGSSLSSVIAAAVSPVTGTGSGAQSFMSSGIGGGGGGGGFNPMIPFGGAMGGGLPMGIP